MKKDPFNEPTLKQKTAKGIFWGGANSAMQQLIGLLFGIYIARRLNSEDYGLVAMLAIFTGIAGALINSGFSVTLTNKQYATSKDYNSVFWFTFVIGIALYLLLFFLAPIIASFYNRFELIELSRIIFISFFFTGIATVPYTVMFKRLMVKEQAQIDIFSMLLSGIVGCLLAYKDFAYWALAWQSVVYVVCRSILYILKSPWKPSFSFSFKPLREMFPFSCKLVITTIFQQINNNVLTVMLGKFYNAQQLGYYSQGNKWAVLGSQLVGGMLGSVFQPVIVQVRNDKIRQLNIFRKILRFTAFVAFPIFMGFAFISNEFILLTIGEKYQLSVPFLQVFCIWGIVYPFITLFSFLLLSHGKSDIFLWGNIFTGALQLILLSILHLLQFDIIFLAIGVVIVYIFSFLFWFYYSKPILGIRLIDVLKDIMPYFVITVFSISIIKLFTITIIGLYLLLILKVTLTALLYFSILWILRSKILKESVELLTKKK